MCVVSCGTDTWVTGGGGGGGGSRAVILVSVSR